MKVWVQLGIVQKCFKDEFFRHFLVPFLGMFFFQLKTCNGMKVGWFGLGLFSRSPYLSVVPYCRPYNFSTFSIIQMKYFFLIPEVQEIILADPGKLSGELQGKLGLDASKNSIFQKLTSKIGPNSNFVIFTKKSKISIGHEN